MAKSNKKVAAPVVAATASATEANRKARLARHAKQHPNDQTVAQSKGTPRKKPKAKGSAPQPVLKIRDKAGNLIHRGSLFGFVPDAPRKRDEALKEKAPFFEFKRGPVAAFGEKDVKQSKDDIESNVRALCFGLNIRFTGARSKGKAKRSKK